MDASIVIYFQKRASDGTDLSNRRKFRRNLGASSRFGARTPLHYPYEGLTSVTFMKKNYLKTEHAICTGNYGIYGARARNLFVGP